MEKRILISLSIIGIVCTIAIGLTIAYFGDTEVSKANILKSGGFDLKIDSHCYQNGKECICSTESGRCCFDENGNKNCEDNERNCTCTWQEKDLKDEVFVNFSDLKPGDWGENTISFHIKGNEGWLCANVKITEDSDNGCVEPELKVEPNCETDNDGELDNYLKIFAWGDNCNEGGAFPGDNKYQPGCDKKLMTEPETIKNYEGDFSLVDKTFSFVGEAGTPLEGNKTYYIGFAWCFGKMNIEDDGTITCESEVSQNEAQTDKLTLDVTFKAIQARNNSDFVCSSGDNEEKEETKTFNPSKDAYITEFPSNVNDGGNDILEVLSGGMMDVYTLIAFDLSSLSGKDVQSATLRLYRHCEPYIKNELADGRTYEVYTVTEDWDEMTVTWNNQPSIDGIVATATVPVCGNWMEWDVTKDVKDFVNGTKPNYGWLIKDVESHAQNWPASFFRSKEYFDSDYIPQLVVTYK